MGTDEKVKRVNRLIKAIAKGEINALEQLYQEFGGLLLLMMRKYLYDKQNAEDMLSEVYLRLVRTAPQFKDGYNGLNWLFKTIKNTAINENIRSLKKQTEEYNEQNIIGSVLIEECLIDGLVISSAIEKLSEQEKIIITKKYWECLTVREIAKELGLSVAKTQRLIKSALKTIGKDVDGQSR